VKSLKTFSAALRLALKVKAIEDQSVQKVIGTMASLHLDVPRLSYPSLTEKSGRVLAVLDRLRVVRSTCLTRSLVLGALLARAYPEACVGLVIGFRPTQGPISQASEGHAWVTVDGKTIQSATKPGSSERGEYTPVAWHTFPIPSAPASAPGPD